jgi:hypothetical protein
LLRKEDDFNMGIAAIGPFPSSSSSIVYLKTHQNQRNLDCSTSNSMSQDYQQAIFGFSSNGFERSSSSQQQQQQIQRDKVRLLQGLNLSEGEGEERGGVYETAGMLSEMFNFADPSTAELLETATFRSSSSSSSRQHPQPTGSENDWYGNNRQGMQQHQQQISSINVAADSAAAMQLFLMNPSQSHQTTTSSSSPPPPHHQNSSTLHMLLPNPPNNTLQGFPNSGNFGQFTWNSTTTQEGGVVEGQGVQGLSLSLSSSLEAAKAEEELRMGGGGGGDGGSFLYNNYNIQGGSGGPSSSSYPYKLNHQQALNLQLQGGGTINGYQLLQSHNQGQGYGSVVVNVLRNSKYMKPTQELLQEFCSVGRGQFIKKTKFNRQNSSNPNNCSSNVGDSNPSSSSKDTTPLPLSAADRIEHQRRKVKLLSMLDEACNLSPSLSFSLHQGSRSPPPHIFFFIFI